MKDKKKPSIKKKPETDLISVKENKEIIITDEQGSIAENMIRLAIEKNVPVETLERLLEMRDKLKKEKAEENFNHAMATFQSDCPTIIKTKTVKTIAGTVAYKYAPIDSIVEQVKPYLKKYGFSYSIKQIYKDNRVKTTCIVKHIDGHFENTEMEVPLGTKTKVMSDSQVVAAATTFAKRYAFCNAFGILTGDEDTDGRDEPGTKTENETTDKIGKKGMSVVTEPAKNDISYYKNVIDKKIISRQDLKDRMIEIKIIKPGTRTMNDLYRILKNLSSESDCRLKVAIGSFLDKNFKEIK